MPESKYFIIRHGLDAFEMLPNYVWNTGGKNKVPHRYKQITKGSKWISYAYTDSDDRKETLRYVTGFWKCVEPYHYGPIPSLQKPKVNSEWYNRGDYGLAWLIEGEPDENIKNYKVLVPSINCFYDTNKFNQQAITPITYKEYNRIRDYVIKHEIPPFDIPIFGREPETEQELLAIFIQAHKTLGVKRILQVHQAFPDMKIELDGVAEAVQIELELYSQNYICHNHPINPKIAILCWLNDIEVTKCNKVLDRVHIFELSELLKQKRKIIWRDS